MLAWLLNVCYMNINMIFNRYKCRCIILSV